MKKITAAPIMRTPSAAPMPTPALAPLLSPLEDDDEACDVLVVLITVEEVGEGKDDGVDEAGEAVVVVAGLVDVSAAEADVATVIIIGRELEADEE